MKIHDLLKSPLQARIAVIGDLCLDLYYFVDTELSERSVETELPVYSVQRAKHDLGGAGNVAINCKHLGNGIVDIYGLIGDDQYGAMINRLLDQEEIGREGVLIQERAWQTHVYHKIFEGDSELPRYDMGNFNIPDNELIDRIFSLLEKKLDSYGCVIINEQIKHGLHSPYFQKKLQELMSSYEGPVLWFADCRNLNDTYPNAIHKLNNHEGRALYQAQVLQEPDDVALVQWLHKRWKKPVVLTRAENGALVCDEEKVTSIRGLHFIQSIDIVGAGDAFLSGLAVSMLNGGSISDSAMIGNFAAGVALTKLYETGHPSREEVIALSENAAYRYNPALAADPRLATYYENSDIEIITDPKSGKFSERYPEIAIFDHDGTISTLRQGWELIMRDMMISSILGDMIDQVELKTVEKVASEVDALIEKSTGVQTIIQMQHLTELVLRFGYIKDDAVLDCYGYKHIFNERLKQHIRKKIELFKQNRLALEDVTMKLSVSFLHHLYEKGVTLYLASGTDEADVVQEAELLGYASLFTGGIKGSVGNPDCDPKRQVIKQILQEVHIDTDASKAKRCIVFGDGPVEMREAARYNIPAVGLLSDEKQRFGKNMAKRNRLVLAGADLLIPDFSCKDDLIRLMGWGKS